jgi:hypothetical protein
MDGRTVDGLVGRSVGRSGRVGSGRVGTDGRMKIPKLSVRSVEGHKTLPNVVRTRVAK